jgi:hypothetical protein
VICYANLIVAFGACNRGQKKGAFFRAPFLYWLAAIPACGELAFVFCFAVFTAPGGGRAFVKSVGLIQQLHRSIVVQVVFDPELWPGILKGHLPDDGAEIFVANERRNAFAGEQILVMIYRDNRIRRRYFFPSRPRKNSAGSSPRSSTSTRAEPTIAPAACTPTFATSAAARMPKPAQTGSCETADTRCR